jgi:hypothetical protein
VEIFARQSQSQLISAAKAEIEMIYTSSLVGAVCNLLGLCRQFSLHFPEPVNMELLLGAHKSFPK